MPAHAPTMGGAGRSGPSKSREGGAPDFHRAGRVRLKRGTGSLLSYDTVMS